MSDGLANTGITDPGEIARLVRGAKHDGVRISAMGLGRDYDEDLMQAIAENGGGRYYYIEHPTQMARVFQEELGSLFETCARDVELQLQRHGHRPQGRSRRLRRRHRRARRRAAALEDVFEGEKRSVLLRLEIAAAIVGPRRSRSSRPELQDRQVRPSPQLHAELCPSTCTSDRAAVDRPATSRRYRRSRRWPRATARNRSR